MEESENTLQDKLLNFAKSNLLVLALFAGGLIFLGIGLIQFLGQKQTEVKFEKGSTVLGSESDSSAKIKVDVEGAVISPGVYELSSGARVQDALIAAGGLASDADRNSINLAAKMADGQKIYIPKKGEEVQLNANSPSVSSSNVISTANVSGLISINSASQSDLETLPGIGPVTAGKIINARPYNTLEELVSKKAVGQKTFEKIKDLISL